MRKNKLIESWRAGHKTVNGWCAIPSGFATEVMAHQGFDSLTIDTQHGIVDYQAMVSMLQAISTTDVTPLVRVPWREPGIIMKTLDAGAYGIICPMVNNAEQARELVNFAYYPPRGTRSFGPIRALIYGGADYSSKAAEEVLIIAMIETKEAMDNLDEIMAVEGIDAVYVGPADLSNSLGYTPKFDQEEKPVFEAIERIVQCAKKHGKFAGIHCGAPSYAKRMHALGYEFATILSDARLMAMHAQKVLAEMKEDAPASSSGGSY